MPGVVNIPYFASVSSNMDFSTINFRRWLLTIFALCCLGLNFVIYTLYAKNQEVINSKEWVQHTYEVLVRGNRMFFALQDMETAVRGFLLTGQNRFLDPYIKAQAIYDESHAVLRELTSDNAARKRRSISPTRSDFGIDMA